MLTVGLTGCFQAGKTTVLSMFEKCGARVLSADWLVHQAFEHNQVFIREVRKMFGPSVFTQGKINRRALAERVFSDKRSLDRLNKLVHPYVQEKMISFFKACYARYKDSIVVVEVPLLFEACFEKYFDVTVVISTQPEVVGRRLCGQGVFSSKDMKARNAHQFSLAKKIARCDFVIDNNAGLKQTFCRVKEFMGFLEPLKSLSLGRIRE